MSKVSRNLAYLLVSQIATWSITLVVLIVAPNLLGPQGFGQLGFAASFVGLFTMVASLGTMPLLIKSVARDRQVLGPYVANAVALKVVLVAVLSAIAVLLARALGSTGDALLLVGIGCVGMLFTVLNDVFVGALAGLERMGRPAMWAVVQTYAGSGIGLLVLALGGGVVPYAIVFAFSGIIPLLANGRAVRPVIRGSDARMRRSIWWFLVRGGVPLMVLHGLFRLYGSIDIPILLSITDDTTVGWYAVAYRLVTVPIFIATTVVRAFFPSFSAHGATVSDEFKRQVNRAVRLVVIVSVPAAAGISAVSASVVDLLYDEQFTQAGPIMSILALHIPFAAVGLILGSALVASDRQGRYVVVAGLAAVLAPFAYTIGINWALDRFDNGAIGAAVATVAIEVFMLAGALVVRSKGVMDRRTTMLCARAVVAGIIMGVVVWVLNDLPLPARVVIGVAVYAIASLGVRSVTPEELRQARHRVAGLFGGRGARREVETVGESTLLDPAASEERGSTS